jgi:hypothetical protein
VPQLIRLRRKAEKLLAEIHLGPCKETSAGLVSNSRPCVGPEGRRRQTFFVRQIELGAVAPGVADCDWRENIRARKHDRIALDLRVGPMKDVIGACYGETGWSRAIRGAQAAADVREVNRNGVSANLAGLVERAPVDDGCL